METIGRWTTLLLHALETREPAVELLSSFVDHWKAITKYYVESTDDSRPVKQTDIPWRLKQMLDILVYEEKQQGAETAGPCLEFLLEHKLPETLVSLGKAEYPPGMKQQVLVFFSKLLSQMQKPLMELHRVSVPLQKLIGLCALPGSQAEKEEAQLLLVVCSRLKQEPHTLCNFLECAEQWGAGAAAAAGQSQPGSERAPPPARPDASASQPPPRRLLSCLLQLTKSQRACVSLKAYESLLLLCGEPEVEAGQGELLAARTQLGELLVGRLLSLYSLLLLEPLEAAALQGWTHTPWSSQFSRGGSESPDHVTNFFCWFDFLDHLMRDASRVLSVKIAECVHQLWLVEVVQPQLLSVCERSVLVSTSVVCAAVRWARSPPLLEELVSFLLKTPAVRRRLIRNCDHISDQLSMASLSVVEELVQKPHADILKVLVLDSLEQRSYLSPPAGGQEDAPDSDELEDDPFFSDSLFPEAPPDSSPLPPPLLALGSAADVINSFLCLVPVGLQSGRLLQDNDGLESYVLDARTLVEACECVSASFDWPASLPPPPCSSSSSSFSEGELPKVLLDRLGRVLEQPYELNLQLTAVLSRLAAFRHPLLQEYLLDPYATLSPHARSLFSVLVGVMGQLALRSQQLSGLTHRLLEARRQLLGLDHHSRLDDLTLLRGVIVLEEFCKELAAIAFTKLDQH